MLLSVHRALEYLTKERLQEICRQQNLKVSGSKPEVIDRLADFCRQNLATMLDCLDKTELFEIAWHHFDEGAAREFVLSATNRRPRPEGMVRPSEPAKFYSTGCIGDTSPLDVAAIKADASKADRATVFSAYYVPRQLEQLLVNCGDVRFVTNGLGGRRLKEQIDELGELEERLNRQNRSAVIRIRFSKGIFHTKLYVFESGSNAVAWTGSANATSAALQGHNEEVLVRLDPAPPSILQYANSVWDTSHDLTSCRPRVDSLAAFFRTGDLYYPPYAHLRVTVNPFKPILERLPQSEKAKLSRFTSPYAETDSGIGAFNVRRVYEVAIGHVEDVGPKKQARIRAYAVETCYGYWVPEPFMGAVKETIGGASAERIQFLEDFLGWLEGEGFERTMTEFRGYLADAKRTVDEFEVDWEAHASDYGYLFESTDRIENCVEDLIGQLRNPVDREKHAHSFVSARLPEIWDDVVARTYFEKTFFEWLEAESSRPQWKRVVRWILHNVNVTGEAAADVIQKKLETRLADPAWYSSVKDGSLLRPSEWR